MRVGLYNRYLATMGGGEKHSLAIAERISQYYPVDVISHQPVSKEEAAQRFDLDLSRVTFVVTPELSSQTLPALTQGYDLFINASFMDFFPSLAKHSATLIFFPAKLNFQIAARRAIKHLARTWFNLPEFVVGMHHFELAPIQLNWYTNSVVKIALPAATQPYQFRFNVSSLDGAIQTARIELDHQVIAEISISTGKESPYEVSLPGGKGTEKHELVLTVPGSDAISGEPRLVINHLDLTLPGYRLYRALFENSLGKSIAYKLNFYPAAFSILEHLNTFDALWANSEFTRKWIRRYWRRESEVLFPPVNIGNFYTTSKKQQILSVGRFFAGQHNKKHLEMIQAFKSMVDRGLLGWELHLAGGTDPREEHQQYFRKVQEAARGYPIFLHPNIPPGELLQLYAESAIYWHASGYGEDENRDPEKFEHFGITTVEAMAAGCCPVVIGKGGQPEIVQHGVNGFLWQSLDELQALTQQLIDNEALRLKFAQAAAETSWRFDKCHFNEQIDAFLDRLGLLP